MISLYFVEDRIEFSLYKCEISKITEELAEFLCNKGSCVVCGRLIKLDSKNCKCGLNFDDQHASYTHLMEQCGAKYGKDGFTCNDFIGRYEIQKCDEQEFLYLRTKANRKTSARKSSKIRQRRERQIEGFYNETDIFALFIFQKGKCYYCSTSIGSHKLKNGIGVWSKLFQKDHLNPLVRGGTNWPHNIALVCGPCNRRKHIKTEKYFWEILINENGKRWFNKREKERLLNQKNKRKLTRVRKSEEKKGIGKNLGSWVFFEELRNVEV